MAVLGRGVHVPFLGTPQLSSRTHISGKLNFMMPSIIDVDAPLAASIAAWQVAVVTSAAWRRSSSRSPRRSPRRRS
ncbi:hypothetical protein ACFPRL_13845 [Pseudoclavibacter helvolus]